MEKDNNEKTNKYENIKLNELNNLNIISNFENKFLIKVEELDKALKNCVKYEKQLYEEKEKTKYSEQIISAKKILEEKNIIIGN